MFYDSPIAISNSLCRHLIPVDGLWFQIHRTLNVLVLITTVIGFAIVVNAIEESRLEPDHFESTEGVMNKHKTIGLVVFILVIVQAIGGAMRPHLPAASTGEDKSTVRILWEFAHKVSGYLILAMAWYQCHSGLVLYARIFVEDETHTNIFWGIVGAISGIALVGFLTRFIFPPDSRSTTSSSRNGSTDNNKKPGQPDHSETAVRSGVSDS
jgi:hypothetical protein